MNNYIYFENETFGPIYTNTTHHLIDNNIAGIILLTMVGFGLSCVLYYYHKDTKNKSPYQRIL